MCLHHGVVFKITKNISDPPFTKPCTLIFLWLLDTHCYYPSGLEHVAVSASVRREVILCNLGRTLTQHGAGSLELMCVSVSVCQCVFCLSSSSVYVNVYFITGLSEPWAQGNDLYLPRVSLMMLPRRGYIAVGVCACLCVSVRARVRDSCVTVSSQSVSAADFLFSLLLLNCCYLLFVSSLQVR